MNNMYSNVLTLNGIVQPPPQPAPPIDEESTTVLVSIGNFQEYILINIRNLLFLKNKNIYVITDREFEPRFEEFRDRIQLVFREDYQADLDALPEVPLDKSFRHGFWYFTTYRLFMMYVVMRRLRLTNVFHIENDVVTYYPFDMILKKLKRDRVYLPFDRYQRNILSVFFIPTVEIFEMLLQKYNTSVIDMTGFAILKKLYPNQVENLPIGCPEVDFNPEQRFVCNQFDVFNMIFDGIALGQYLGGIDPRNTDTKDTVGFINETCCILYNRYSFHWSRDPSGYKRPFMKVGNRYVPIFNLHIHSKNLERFVEWNSPTLSA